MPSLASIFAAHELRESAIAAEREAHAAWIEANGGQEFLNRITGADRYIGREVSFLECSRYAGCRGTVRKAERDGGRGWILHVRLSPASWRMGNVSEGQGNPDPGFTVMATLGEVTLH